MKDPQPHMNSRRYPPQNHGRRSHASGTVQGSSRTVITIAGVGVITASCLTLASLFGGLSDASSAPAGDVVVLGDSYYSSPNVEALTLDCAQSEQNWPRLAAAETGVAVHDWSCGGATSETLLGRIDAASKAKEIGPNTRTVFLSIGGNDFSHQGAVRGLEVTDLETRRNTVLGNVSTAVDKIHNLAPDAKIVMSSYIPSTVGPYVCRTAGSVNGVSAPEYDPELDAVEKYISDTMSVAAKQHDATFVDIRSAADGNSTCSPVGERYLAGDDDGAADVLMAWHPTQAGVRFMADQFIPEIT